MKTRFTSIIERAAMTLPKLHSRVSAVYFLMMLLTTATAWADNVNYYDPTDANNPTKTAENPAAITGETTTLGIVDQTTWYYVSGEVTCNNRIEVIGTVNIILVDNGRLNANSGIHLTEGNTLNIWAQSAGSGYLYVKSIWQDDRWYNAIGGNGGENSYLTDIAGDNGENAGDLNIYGGYIEADGQIGGGNGGAGMDYYDWVYNDKFGDPLDEPYEVLAQGGTGGDGGNGGTINIYGGNIHANDIVGGGIGGSCQGTRGDDGTATINLSWSKATDRIYINTYLGTVTLLKEFTETNGEIFDANSQHNNGDGINGRTLMPSVGDSYSVTIAGGYDPSCLTANRTTAKEGVTITLTAVNHYVINSLTVKDASNQTVSTAGSGPWTFTMPGSDVTVTPTATRYYSITKDATVTLSADDSDKLQQSGHTYYRPGATISFTLNIAEDKDLQSVSVTCNGQPVTYYKVGDTYTFTMQSGDVTITPTYETIGYTIGKQYYMTLSTASGNVTTRNGKDYYKAGAEITVTLDIPDCYRLDYFRVNNGNVSATDNHDGTWTFTMPEQRVTLSASYSIDPSAVLTLGGTSDFKVTGGTSDYGKLLDGDTSTDWYTWGYWDSGYTCYVEFQTAAPVIPKGYMLTTTSNSSNYYQGEYNPSVWTLQAKLDENDAWTTIADVSDGGLSDWDNVTSTFNVDNRGNNAYQYFRFEVKGTQGHDEDDGMGMGMIYHVTSEDMLLSEMQLLVMGAELTMNASGIMTYASTATLDFSSVSGLTAYIASDFNGTAGTLTLSSVGAVPASTGLLLKGTASKTFVVPFAVSATAPATNYLVGVTDGTTSVPVTTATNTNFILANGLHGINWYTLYEDGAIGANKAYLSLPTDQLNLSNNAAGFTWVYDGEATGVRDVKEVLTPKGMSVARNKEVNDNSWYNLDGRKLDKQPMQKGVYIHGGHKVVIK